MKKLLKQANIKIDKMYDLVSKIEAIENILEISGNNTEIALYEPGVGTTKLSLVLPEIVATSLKETVLGEVRKTLNDNTIELQQFIGKEWTNEPDSVDKKLAEILKSESDKPSSEKPALDDSQVDNVRRMYHDEAKTMKEIAEYYGMTKSQVNTYISKHKLRRTSYKKGYLDSEPKKKPSEVKPLRAQNDIEKCRVCGNSIWFTPKMTREMWAYKYKRKQNGREETVYCCNREHFTVGKAKDN